MISSFLFADESYHLKPVLASLSLDEFILVGNPITNQVSHINSKGYVLSKTSFPSMGAVYKLYNDGNVFWAAGTNCSSIYYANVTGFDNSWTPVTLPSFGDVPFFATNGSTLTVFGNSTTGELYTWNGSSFINTTVIAGLSGLTYFSDVSEFRAITSTKMFKSSDGITWTDLGYSFNLPNVNNLIYDSVFDIFLAMGPSVVWYSTGQGYNYSIPGSSVPGEVWDETRVSVSISGYPVSSSMENRIYPSTGGSARWVEDLGSVYGFSSLNISNGTDFLDPYFVLGGVVPDNITDVAVRGDNVNFGIGNDGTIYTDTPGFGNDHLIATVPDNTGPTNYCMVLSTTFRR